MRLEAATRLYLLRHGEVVGHGEYRYNGHTDVDITDKGVAQMDAAAHFLASVPADPKGLRPTGVYSSDLTRAVKGGEIIASRLGLAPERLKSLRELHLGRWEGLTWSEATERYPEEAHFTFKHLAENMKVKGGESVEELRSRIMPAIEGIVSSHKGSAACVVAHGGVNRVILCEALGLDLGHIFNIEQDYGCINVIDFLSDGMCVVKLLNGGPNQKLKPTVLY